MFPPRAVLRPSPPIPQSLTFCLCERGSLWAAHGDVRSGMGTTPARMVLPAADTPRQWEAEAGVRPHSCGAGGAARSCSWQGRSTSQRPWRVKALPAPGFWPFRPSVRGAVKSTVDSKLGGR